MGKLPIKKSYKIGQSTYKVITSKDIPDIADAEVDLDRKLIKIRPGLSKYDRELALRHELFHALWHESRFYNFGLPSECEELVVDCFAAFSLSLKR